MTSRSLTHASAVMYAKPFALPAPYAEKKRGTLFGCSLHSQNVQAAGSAVKPVSPKPFRLQKPSPLKNLFQVRVKKGLLLQQEDAVSAENRFWAFPERSVPNALVHIKGADSRNRWGSIPFQPVGHCVLTQGILVMKDVRYLTVLKWPSNLLG